MHAIVFYNNKDLVFSEAPSQISLATESNLNLASSDEGFPELPDLCTHFIPDSPTVFEEDEDGGEPPSEDNGARYDYKEDNRTRLGG